MLLVGNGNISDHGELLLGFIGFIEQVTCESPATAVASDDCVGLHIGRVIWTGAEYPVSDVTFVSGVSRMTISIYGYRLKV